MDAHNNNVAADGPEHKTWEEVVAWARGKIIEAAAHDGDGEEGRAFWYTKQPPTRRPYFTGVPIAPIEKGGPEHRYSADEEDGAEEALPSASVRADPLDRPVATWSEQNVRSVLNSPAYLEPQHARHDQAQRLVRAWFERRFGTGPARADATGRPVREARATARSGGCSVPVRAHTRQGGKVEMVGALPRRKRLLTIF
jgi:hypothetical protein